MKETTRRALIDLVEMARRLEEYRFDEHVRRMGLGFHIQKNDDETSTVEFDLPDEKERDATLYTLRLFDQQNESFSFHRLNQIATDSGLSHDYIQEISGIRSAYFEYLNGTPEGVEAGFFEDGRDPTRGEIMRVVMNGWLGHRRDPEKRERYSIWTRESIREAVLHQEFTKIIYVVLGTIRNLHLLTIKELEIDAP